MKCQYPIKMNETIVLQIVQKKQQKMVKFQEYYMERKLITFCLKLEN